MSVKPKQISQYFEKPRNIKLIQARIDSDLLEEIRKLKSQDNVSWDELIMACFRRYRDERQRDEK